ncbi:unnamed protein product [Euphydryas editha]|uniref:CCHC-type domain-containing protein n=1 Tax=Euphydryas editha TaxID=104508 RepID=A0AAU9TKP8_EUPED|nr:unnamed protein product [Euphydryas editha]
MIQPSRDEGAPRKSPPTCYFCNEKGHIATHCPKKEVTTNERRIERRVDVCAIKPATDYLTTETGEKFSFCFDSGSECSLLKENIANKFPGKRQNTVVTLIVNKQEQRRVNLTEITNNWLLAEQQKDPEIKSLITKLQANELDSEIAKTYEKISRTHTRTCEDAGRP